jgi:hypothetical protein
MSGKIVQYIRDGRGQRIGAVVAVSNETEGFHVGWSVCNKKDRFDKHRALQIATGRAEVGTTHTQPVRMVNRAVTDGNVSYNVRVDAVSETINKVKSRAAAYFKGVTA